MTSPAQPISTPPGQPASRKRMRKRDSVGVDKRTADPVSVAKMGMIGTIGAALVTAVTSIVVGFTHDNGSGGTNSAAHTIKPKLDKTSTLGSFDQVAINESGTAVTVTGSAAKDVDGVVVLIGPRQSGGQYWANSTNVVNQHWTLVVTTDPHVPAPYEIKAYYRERAGSATTRGAPYVTPRQTGTPPPPPGKPVLLCAEQHGDSCFDGPGWGPPSIFRSDH